MSMYDIFINAEKLRLDAIEGYTEVNTTLLQAVCLVKFAKVLGYERWGHQFVNPDNKAARVITTSNMVLLYNDLVPDERYRDMFPGPYIERVYLAGRNLSRCAIMKHRVKFL